MSKKSEDQSFSKEELYELKYFRRKKDTRWKFFIFATVLCVFCFGLFIVRWDKFFNGDSNTRIIATFAILYFLLALTYFYFYYRSAATRLDDIKERILLRKQLNLYPDTVFDSATNSEMNEGEKYFEKLVAINVENLSAYYLQVKVHANRGFTASITTGILGFIILTAGLIYGFTASPNNATIAYLAFASGIIIEFISAVFFYIHNKTVAQMKSYHDSLLYVQNILLSLKLIEGVEDKKMKDAATAQIVEYLVKRPDST